MDSALNALLNRYSTNMQALSACASYYFKSDMAFTIPKKKKKYQCLYCLEVQKKDKRCKNCGKKGFVAVEAYD